MIFLLSKKSHSFSIEKWRNFTKWKFTEWWTFAILGVTYNEENFHLIFYDVVLTLSPSTHSFTHSTSSNSSHAIESASIKRKKASRKRKYIKNNKERKIFTFWPKKLTRHKTRNNFFFFTLTLLFFTLSRNNEDENGIFIPSAVYFRRRKNNFRRFFLFKILTIFNFTQQVFHNSIFSVA